MTDSPRGFLEQLQSAQDVFTVELRPPMANLLGPDSMDAWIDTYHAVRRLVRKGRFLFLTDNAVGAAEEENLSHLGANLAEEVRPTSIIPFLTCKHSLDYCLRYAERAWAQGFRALTVLGGDQTVGAPRCFPHAYELRRRIRERVPGLALGGWANPHRDPHVQAGYLTHQDFTAEFWLSQVVSHHSLPAVEAFLRAMESGGVTSPGIFGVFYYRSGNPKTLERLSPFFPVPSAELNKEFSQGASPEEICARSIRALLKMGVRNLYLSNLPMEGAAAVVDRILEKI
jgi:5,10-methylenetetrahydrofolate reductase